MYKNQRNPILPIKYFVPDCEAKIMPDGKLYLYGSLDLPETIYCSNIYHVFRTSDLQGWEVFENAFNSADISWLPYRENLKHKGLLWAPDATYHNGEYILFFCMDSGLEGFATSKNPYGPFENAQKLPCDGIDPAVFIDDDGRGYYYWGQFNPLAVKLNDDMKSFEQEHIVQNILTEKEHNFHEGVSVRKINDTYYAIFTDISRGKATSIGYATAPTPLVPFKYQGIIIDNDGCDPATWNNHGSIQEYNGQWYVFYHRTTKNTKNNRRLCIEKIYINEDGTIDEVLMTSQGVGDPFKSGDEIMAYQTCGLTGSVYIDKDEVYGEKLTNIEDNDSAVFRYVKNNNDYTSITFVTKGKADIAVCFDGLDKATYNINSDGDNKFNFFAHKGKYELGLKFMNTKELEIYKIILV